LDTNVASEPQEHVKILDSCQTMPPEAGLPLSSDRESRGHEMGLFKHRGAAKGTEQEPESQPAAVAEASSDVVTALEPRTGSVSGSEMQRLWSDGLPARATVTQIRDTGQRLAGITVLDLDLAVTRDDGEPYETTLRLPIAGGEGGPFATGSEYNVRVDPQDRTRLVFAA
jgi:hypothetical protein